MKFMCEVLTPDVINMAQRELGETEEVRRKTLTELKNLIKDEPDLYSCLKDSFLVCFLRAKKFDVIRAFKTLQTYYRFKARQSGIMTDLKPSDLRHVLRLNTIIPLEDRDENGAAISVIRVGKFDLEQFPPEKFLAVGLLLIELAGLMEVSSICGHSLIFDIGGLTIRNFHRLASPSFVYNFVHSFQDVMPNRLKSIHIINAPIYFDIFLKMCKFFLTEKLKKRLHVHGSSMESLHKHYSPNLLPEEYGGKQGPLSEQSNKINAKLLQFDDHFEQRNKYGYQLKNV